MERSGWACSVAYIPEYPGRLLDNKINESKHTSEQSIAGYMSCEARDEPRRLESARRGGCRSDGAAVNLAASQTRTSSETKAQLSMLSRLRPPARNTSRFPWRMHVLSIRPPGPGLGSCGLWWGRYASALWVKRMTARELWATKRVDGYKGKGLRSFVEND